MKVQNVSILKFSSYLLYCCKSTCGMDTMMFARILK